MNLRMELDPPTAIKIAGYFEKDGATQLANKLWLEISNLTTYDRRLQEQLADTLFDLRQAGYPFGTLTRSRLLLNLMRLGFPTPKLVDAYFENLDQMLSGMPKLPRPGLIVLGAGSGRCGSTTLSAAFAAQPDACATHENPPNVDWEPLPEQVRFHLDRCRRLVERFPLVFDAAHWWINVLEPFFAAFPDAKVIGLARDTEACVASFLKFQRRGFGSFNYWAPPGNGIWTIVKWNPTYPKYDVPSALVPNTDEAYETKRAMVRRYVTEYNQRLAELAQADPRRILVLRTETLGDPATARQLSDFVGRPIEMPAESLNVGTDRQGSTPEYWY